MTPPSPYPLRSLRRGSTTPLPSWLAVGRAAALIGLLPVLASHVAACSTDGPATVPPAGTSGDADNAGDVAPPAPDALAGADAGSSPDPGPADTEPGDAAARPAPDAEENDTPDAAGPGDTGGAACLPWPQPAVATGPLPAPASEKRGIEAAERPAYELLRDAVLADPEVHFVATWDRDADAFVVDTADAHLVFRRIRLPAGGVEIAVLEGAVASIFPSTDPTLFGDYDALLAALENPEGTDLSGLGYDADDPRVGWLPPAAQSFPHALMRIATLFDAPDAPDLVVAAQPWAHPGAGTHGGLSLLQSRSTLVLSGRGVRSGVVLDQAAALPDVAPTVLALLGAHTTGGVGPDGVYQDGLHLTRQDGRVLLEALSPDPCDRPGHVLLVLFDGLVASEINRQILAETPDVDLPRFRGLGQAGVVYRGGAVSNFPSLSAPGHMTVSCGLWSGHHNLVANAWFQRGPQEVVNPFVLLDDPSAVLADPSIVVTLFDAAVAPGVETLAEAVHRGLDPSASVVVINEIGFRGADYSTLDFVAGTPLTASLDTYELADDLALVQITPVLANTDVPVPTLLQVSLLATDAAGEQAGPHSPLLRETLLRTDARLGQILDAYADRGVLDDTLVVLVSDHGMELQRPGHTTKAPTLAAASGVRFMFFPPGLVWLRTLTGTVDGATVRVQNLDNDTPVADATVACATCEPTALQTDAAGEATFASIPAGATLELSHPDFNPQVVAGP